MPERILFPEWRAQNEPTAYPFTLRASRVNDAGRVIVEGLFLDAAFYAVGGREGVYLSQVEITHQTVTLTIGDAGSTARASGSFSLAAPGTIVALEDSYGRPAGAIISEPERFGTLTAWGVGTHTFRVDQSEFVPTVSLPTPELGVRGLLLDDGSVFVGDVWLVGDDGVVLRTRSLEVPGTGNQPAKTVTAIRVDVVGDPLFRRRLCQPNDLFTAPRFIKTVRFVADNMNFECSPNEQGELHIGGNNDLASDTVLRIVPTATGLKVGAVGSPIQS